MEIDSPRRFNTIGTDGTNAIFEDGKEYTHLSELQSLGNLPASSVAVLFQVPDSFDMDVIQMSHAHFSSLGITSYYLEYDHGKYQRLTFDEQPKESEDNTHVIILEFSGEKVQLAGKAHLLDNENTHRLLKNVATQCSSIAIRCSGDVKCEQFLRLLSVLNLAPYQKLYLEILPRRTERMSNLFQELKMLKNER